MRQANGMVVAQTRRPSSSGRTREEVAALTINYHQTKLEMAVLEANEAERKPAEERKEFIPPAMEGYSRPTSARSSRPAPITVAPIALGQLGSARPGSASRQPVSSARPDPASSRPGSAASSRPGSAVPTARGGAGAGAAHAAGGVAAGSRPTSAAGRSSFVASTPAPGLPRTTLALNQLIDSFKTSGKVLAGSREGQAFLRTARGAALDMQMHIKHQALLEEARPAMERVNGAVKMVERGLAISDAEMAEKWFVKLEKRVAHLMDGKYEKVPEIAAMLELFYATKRKMREPIVTTTTMACQTTETMFDLRKVADKELESYQGARASYASAGPSRASSASRSVTFSADLAGRPPLPPHPSRGDLPPQAVSRISNSFVEQAIDSAIAKALGAPLSPPRQRAGGNEDWSPRGGGGGGGLRPNAARPGQGRGQMTYEDEDDEFFIPEDEDDGEHAIDGYHGTFTRPGAAKRGVAAAQRREDEFADAAPPPPPPTAAALARRRGSVSADAMPEEYYREQAAKVGKRYLPPKSASEKATIRGALLKNALFQHLTDDLFEKVVYPMMYPVLVRRGEDVITQGDLDGDDLFVIQSGEVDVIVDPSLQDVAIQRLLGGRRDPHDDEDYGAAHHYDEDEYDAYGASARARLGASQSGARVVKRLGPGDAFGELALLYSCPRQATCRAATDVTLWGLGGSDFRALLRQHTTRERSQRTSILSNVKVLMYLTPEERSQVQDALTRVDVPQGTYVIRQGEHGDTFYIVDSGVLSVRKVLTPGMASVEVNTLRAGDYFGETALLLAQERQASVMAVTDASVLVLQKEDFERLLGPLEDVLRRNMRNYDMLNQQLKRQSFW